MMNILRAKLPGTVVAEALLTGKRYAADDAISTGFADESALEPDLLGLAVKHAVALAAKGPGNMAKLKKTLWDDVASKLVV